MVAPRLAAGKPVGPDRGAPVCQAGAVSALLGLLPFVFGAVAIVA